MKILSIRQPWAWLIVNGGKDIENRTWPTRFRGRFLVHASKGMTKREYEDVVMYLESQAKWSLSHHDFVDFNNFVYLMTHLPRPERLKRGGIIGEVTLVDCVKESRSPWFMGKYGFVLKDAKRRKFIPMKGQLGFFERKI